MIDCVHRTFNKEGSSIVICKYLSNETGEKIGTSLDHCNKCQLSGEINKNLLESEIIRVLTLKLNYFIIGHYQESNQGSFLMRCYKHLNDREGKKLIYSSILAAIKNGKCNEEWALHFILENMEDILDEKPKPITIPVPINRGALDDILKMNCCGKNAKDISLIDMHGKLHQISLKNIKSIENVDLIEARTAIQLKSGDMILLKENEKEVRQMMQEMFLRPIEDDSIVGKMLNAGRSIFDVAKWAFGETTIDEEVKNRWELCHKCTATDQDGERLFRTYNERYYCGKPGWENPFRIRSRDGCGCCLDLKIKGKSQSCPQSKW